MRSHRGVAVLRLLTRALIPLVRSLRLIWEADRSRALTFLLLTVVQGGIPIGTAWFAKLVLDRVGAALFHRQDATLVHGALAVAVAYVALRFAGRIVAPFQDYVKVALINRVVGLMRRRLLTVTGDIPDLDHFERKAFLDEIALLNNEANWQPKALLGWLSELLAALFTIVGSLALLWRFQPLLPLVLLTTGIPQVILYERLHRRVYESTARRSEAARMMRYCATVTTDAAAAKELLVFGIGPWFYRRWQGLANQALAEMAGLRRAGLATTLLVVAGNGLVLAASYAYVAVQVASHRLTIGDFALYLSVVVSLQATLASLTSGVGFTVQTLRFMDRLFSFLDGTRPSVVVAPHGSGLPAPPRFPQGLELRNVGFAYPGQTQAVLSNLTCRLRAGETVAVVGENGAGKTTLVKLLTRLYDPTSGEVLLDGRPLAAYDLAGLRQRTAVLFQDFAHFALTAQQNIGVGDVGLVDDRERVLAAARWAGADSVLEKLPQGPDTPLTRAFEGGVDLSGGEWQKVAMARAAMRDAALVILDEPTAALDAQAEYELFQRFREIAEGRTVLLISHRFSTVRMADRILVLEHGSIVENGSHAALVALGGRYATLYELQAGRYR
jgi:ATP-binding cassette, subfamily B, bacterial